MSQRVLITAGANGIGLATAKAFAAAGARVHIADIKADAVSAVTSEFENITGSVTDVSNPDAVAALFEDVKAIIMGLGGGAFPLAITMFNKRTRTAAGSAAIAGFAMGLGYLAGTLGPLTGGALFSATGSWVPALVVFALTSILMRAGAWMMTPQGPRGQIHPGTGGSIHREALGP